mgnify:CR=1 FL=1|jgi:hypothetical protein|tara:strand:- start:1970 stop:2599 length:630 start_codon:yes stop_codon:yes gene_type:complete
MINTDNSKETDKLFNEDTGLRDDCGLCKEAGYEVGQKTGYGVIIYKIGNPKTGWFATLSPKTGGNPNDFTIQLMPFLHLTHFSQIESHKGLAENYGIAFSKLSRAMTTILMQGEGLKSSSERKEMSVPIATYGKSTTWKEKKEHLHIKIFPFRGNIGQPYTVDSSFGRKEIFKDNTGKEFAKMNPVKKVMIGKERFSQLTKELIALLKK